MRVKVETRAGLEPARFRCLKLSRTATDESEVSVLVASVV